MRCSSASGSARRASATGSPSRTASSPRCSKIFGVFARVDKPIDFEALDGEPVDLILLLVAPESAGADHLKALARAARLLRSQAITAKLRASRDAGMLFSILADEAKAARGLVSRSGGCTARRARVDRRRRVDPESPMTIAFDQNTPDRAPGSRASRQRAAAAPRRDDRARRRHRRGPVRRLGRGDPRRRPRRAGELRDRRRHRLSRHAHAGRDGRGAARARLVQRLHPRRARAPRGLRLGVALLVFLDHRRRRRDDRRRRPAARLDRPPPSG